MAAILFQSASKIENSAVEKHDLSLATTSINIFYTDWMFKGSFEYGQA
ncbi:hypothetical protein ACO0LO_09090 [Undibacterium sp. TJN25]